ncbi:sugar ABC transporter substrate-binding protein [Pseudonocardia zijingensis]|jgi:multiple sugar transport system substrate-binding protein|uniref:Sugar ABC transporter substrate-binding protein n=1 Tax=Pseudonocardia zijingensis TaxID=153376 RepID=A0ABN1QCG1_9PSEU
MRGIRRTLRTSVVVAAAVLAAAGCSSGGESGGEAAEPLSVWQFYGDESMPTGKPFYDVVARYEQESGTEVDIRFIPFDDFNRTLTQAAAAGDGPDIALISAFDTAAMAEAGVIQDIDEQVQAWGQQGAYFPTGWSSTQVDGQTYGIPHLADAYAVYYNTAMVQQAPTTWAEMESTAAALAGEGRAGLAVSGVEGAEGATGLAIRMLAEGVQPTEIDSPGGHAALESFQRMVGSGALSQGFLTWNEDDAKNQFATGQAAMMINSATYVNILREENPDLQWSVAVLPSETTGQTVLSAENLTIGATSDDVDRAWDLITYLQRPEVLQVYLPERNKLPARDDVPGTDEDPVRAIFAEQLQQAWAPDATLAPRNTEVLTALQSALQATISGTPVPDAARAAQATIDEALATS